MTNNIWSVGQPEPVKCHTRIRHCVRYLRAEERLAPCLTAHKLRDESGGGNFELEVRLGLIHCDMTRATAPRYNLLVEIAIRINRRHIIKIERTCEIKRRVRIEVPSEE